MYLERLLQINMATLAVLGASLLGMGQRSEGPPLLVALAAVVSVWLTDITGWFRLDRRVANVLMLLAAVVSLPRSFPVENELQALDFAWFLIYLQILFLFQAKDERKYWLLVMFSLLQVIVATLFNQGIWFGILLAVYMLLGFSAMTLLLLYRQWRRYQPRDEGSGLVCLPGGDDRAGVGADLLGRLGRMALHTMALTLVLFFAVPRFGQTTWRGAVANPKPLVGYSDKVALGTLGQTIEDPGKVMKVRFYDPANDNHQPVAGDIYLQGAILMTYDRGQWQTGLPSWNRNTELLERADPSPPRDLVVQDITIEALDHNELFYVAPFVSLKPTIYLSFNHALQRLLRREEDCARGGAIQTRNDRHPGGVQKPLTPRYRLDSTKQALQFPTVDDAPALPNLVKLAQRWIDQSGLPAKDRLGRARYLERQLAMSGQFQYRLVGQPRDPKLDPIEDFVTKHPAGHCEYFATALDAHAPQPGDSRADGGRLQVRRMESRGRLLPSSPVTRPHLGRGVSPARPDSARPDARRKLLALEAQRRLVAARSHSRRQQAPNGNPVGYRRYTIRWIGSIGPGRITCWSWMPSVNARPSMGRSVGRHRPCGGK